MIFYLQSFLSLVSVFVSSQLWLMLFVPLICLGVIIISVKVVYLCTTSFSRY